MSPTCDRTHVEYLVLADSVEAIESKVTATRGGWDTVHVSDLAQSVMLPFVCGVMVPWAEADAEHRLTLSLAGLDGRPIAPLHEQTFLVGRSRLAGPDDPAHQPFTVRCEVLFPGYGR